MKNLSRTFAAIATLAGTASIPSLALAQEPPGQRPEQGPEQTMPEEVANSEEATASTEAAPARRRGPPPGALENSVFNGDWVSIGVGGSFGPSYDGSNDYNFSVLPIVQGSFGGVDINPRPGGLALDFIEDPDDGIGIDLGIAARFRGERDGRIEDPVVELLGELDRAVEVGPTIGISLPKVLIPVDRLSFSVDTRWDIAGGHSGMVIEPSISYSTPINLGTFASLSLGTQYVDSDYADYYYSISAADSAVTGLQQFDAGAGFTRVSATLVLGFDLSGNALDGGWGLTTITGYSRLIGDAADTPFTSVRGSADQAFVAVGVAYTF